MTCPLCRSDNTKKMFCLDNEGLSVMQCEDCNVAWTNPLPDKGEISNFYPEEYHGKEGRQRFILLLELLVKLSRRKRALDVSKANGGIPGKILDIGCGRGWMLNILKDWGWEVYGTELSTESATFARERLKLNIYTKEVQECSFQEGQFDVVTIWHVFEHLYDPLLTLKESNRILSDNGKLVIEVPNFGGLQARLFGSKWFHLDPPRHLFHFNDKTLKRYLEDAGFRVIKKKTLSWEYDPFGFVQSALNFICFRRDFLYNFLRSREGRMIKEVSSLWDLFASLILSPFLLLISVIVVPLSSTVGKGGVIRYYLRKTEDKL